MARYCGPWLIAGLALQAFGAGAQGPGCLLAIGPLVIGDLNIAARCTLTGTDVRGNVTLFAGGSLIARDVRIRGKLEGSRADFVDIDSSRIDGNVKLDELVGDVASIERTNLRGDVLLTGNRARLEILNNDIAGDFQAFRNTGGLLISGNAFDDDLECANNSPAPVGIGNRVDDEAEGQCEDLQPEAPPSAPEPPTPPPASPPPSTPVPAPPAPPPPASSPPPAAPPSNPSTPVPPTPTDASLVEDDGGAGSIGWPVALLVPLLAWRRSRGRREGLVKRDRE